jgi:four helix bundle protein
MKIERFDEIEAWQLARELTKKIYGLANKGNFAKDYGLKRQIQNAAGSAMFMISQAELVQPSGVS